MGIQPDSGSPRLIQRSYKFRCYPTPAQQRALACHFGAARWVWNFGLNARGKAWRRRTESRSGVGISRLLTILKRTHRYAWLKATPATVLTQALRDQDRAFSNFFAGRARYPRFKKRGHAQAIRFQLDQRQVHRAYRPGYLKLPALGEIKLRWSRTPGGIPKMVTLRRTATGKYFVTFMCEEAAPGVAPAAHAAVGIDLGLRDLVVTSRGDRALAPRHYREDRRRLKRQQRTLARKRKGSARWHRQRRKVAAIHERIANRRTDTLHQLTRRLIDDNQVIGVEDLNVRGMLSNHHLALSIADAAWTELRRQLTYKAAWGGREVVVIDRWAPTSKTCSGCGHRMTAMPLSTRHWACLACGATHDRDVNAAINIQRLATGGRPECHARGGRTIPCGDAAHAALTPAALEARINPAPDTAERTAVTG
ncbi:transposase [Salinisphaera sp. P385]|uniref:Transposase n=1 Tax=Spectribacter acetivorans TaxID=3075603 RepID=A0ABU3B8U1_9GAMM|nr:transposase [Salinisphaera sp. P385]MDT0618588.1 transposase [Salinisphaera sp. P385]